MLKGCHSASLDVSPACACALQRTNKSFNARRWCGSRTYEYYLPAAALGLDTADGSSTEDVARLSLLREVLAAYCGYKPFQNYAGNRSQYVGQKAKGQLVWMSYLL